VSSMATKSQRVLVVEDDASITRMLEVELTEAGYLVEAAASGSEGLAAIEREPPDLVVLDVRLGDLDGLAVCRQVRRSGHRMPILMLTALDRVGDRVLGLDAGADDYLPKPFAIEELLARLRAISRRSGDEDEWLEAGPVRLNPLTRDVTANGAPVELTAREFDLLAFLMHAPGRVFTRDQIFEGVWGYTFLGESKVIDYFVSALRRKLGSDDVIRTVRGVGYAMRP
jgi:two-component system, OmpR family, response regulator MprA